MSFSAIEVFLILLMRRWVWDDLRVLGVRNTAFLLMVTGNPW